MEPELRCLPKAGALVLSKKQARNKDLSIGEENLETCLSQVQLRMENVCPRACNHTYALMLVKSLNLYYLQGQKNPRPSNYFHVGNMLPRTWQNLLRRETLSTQAPQEIYKSRSAKYELTI